MFKVLRWALARLLCPELFANTETVAAIVNRRFRYEVCCMLETDPTDLLYGVIALTRDERSASLIASMMRDRQSLMQIVSPHDGENVVYFYRERDK